MGLTARKGQALVQYLVIAVLIAGAALAFIPVFKETNTLLVTNSGKNNQSVNKEISVPESPTSEIIHPGVPAALPASPPAPSATAAPGSGNLCGPFGCGTMDLPSQEGICGIIPGQRGVMEDGCWICDGVSFWYWEVDMVACGSYWYGDVSNLCASQCSGSPPFFGPNYLESYCYICTNAGTPGYWQRRGYDDPVNNEKFDPGCVDFWTISAPDTCYNDFMNAAVNACGGVAPMRGSMVNPVTGQESCWICDSNINKWINTIQVDPTTSGDAHTSPCTQMWLVDESPDSYNDINDGIYNDYPSCGCMLDPPGNERGPDGRNPGTVGDCWVCMSNSWIPLAGNVATCNDFWVNDNCPPGLPSSLACGDANPPPNPDTFPVSNPGVNNCWLCTNPMEAYTVSVYDNTDNPLYTNFGIPCDDFWLIPDYPEYKNLPNDPDDEETVCANALSSLSLHKAGIIFNPSANQWGCWACTGSGVNYQWVYWWGGRFNALKAGPPAYTAQYKACDDFWVQGAYPAAIPAAPSAPLPCGNTLPDTSSVPYGSCYLCTNPTENYKLVTDGYVDAGNPLYTTYGDPCSEYWHDNSDTTTPNDPDYPEYLDLPNSPDNPDTVCANALPLTDGIKKPGIIYNSTDGKWGCWLCASGTNYGWVYWHDGRFDHIAEVQYQACHKFWMNAVYPTVMPPFPRPYTPTGLTGTAIVDGGNIKIDLSWNSAYGASSYYIYNSTNWSTPWATPSATSFSNTGGLNHLAGTDVEFRVYAHNAVGLSPSYATITLSLPAVETKYVSDGDGACEAGEYWWGEELALGISYNEQTMGVDPFVPILRIHACWDGNKIVYGLGSVDPLATGFGTGVSQNYRYFWHTLMLENASTQFITPTVDAYGPDLLSTCFPQMSDYNKNTSGYYRADVSYTGTPVAPSNYNSPTGYSDYIHGGPNSVSCMVLQPGPAPCGLPECCMDTAGGEPMRSQSENHIWFFPISKDMSLAVLGTWVRGSQTSAGDGTINTGVRDCPVEGSACSPAESVSVSFNPCQVKTTSPYPYYKYTCEDATAPP